MRQPGFQTRTADIRTPLTRRRLLAALGGSALAVTGGAISLPAAHGQQIDASPPAAAPVSGPGATAPSMADKAAELNYDIAKIFRFVADEIAYAPYSGALRGATGTLWARGGNSVDKALLLGALLDEAMVTYQFAMGALDDRAAASLLAATVTDAETERKRWATSIDALLAASPGAGAATPQPAGLTPEQERQLKQQIDGVVALNADAGQLLKTRVATISEALSGAGITLPPLPSPKLPPAEHHQHTWIQMADGPAWIDLDPSLPGAKQGVSLVKPASVGPLPDAVHHKVRFSVMVEEVTGGQPQKREVTAFELTSAEFVNVPVCLLIVPPAAMKGIGNTIDQAMTGKSKLVPTYFTGRGGSYSDSTIVFGSGGEDAQSVLGGNSTAGGLAEGETLAIWSVIDITSPDRDPVHVERALLDRIGTEARASGKVDLARLAPVEYVTSESGESTIKEFQAMWIYAVDTANYPAVLAGIDPISAKIFGGMQLMTQAYPTIRASVSLAHEMALGYRSDVYAPNLVGVTIALAGAAGAVKSDLLVQDPGVSLVRGAPASPVHPLLASGVGNQIAEQLLFARPAGNDATATPPAAVAVDDASAIFAAVEQAGTGWKAVTRGNQLGPFALAGPALVRVKALLDAGMVVVLPERPVESAGVRRWAWWVVDPRTGRTYDQFEDGSSSAGRRLSPDGRLAVEFEEDTVIDIIPYAYIDHYRRTALCVAAVCGVVAGLLGAIAGGVGAASSSSGLGTAGAVLGGVAGGVGGAGSAVGALYACAG